MFKNSPLENDVIARLEDDPRIADSWDVTSPASAPSPSPAAATAEES